MFMKQFFTPITIALVLLLSHVAQAQMVTVVDNTGAGTRVWSSDTTYVLSGLVFVESGDTLVIEPGTIIKAEAGGGNDASALIVSRGGYINAEGTPQNPIIFTAMADDPNDPNDPISTNRAVGQWGGVIILGNALTNNDTERTIEGVSAITTGERARYGGDNDADNSGIFRYVSIRHGGSKIGDGDEINGLTMGAVGSGTTIDHVEVAFNDDDGFEWFGGSVNTSHLVSFFNADDSFDYDQGFRGSGQFWFSIAGDNQGDHGGEHDGAGSGAARTPFGGATVYNATYIGLGPDGGKRTVLMRENTGGTYSNSIFMDFADGFAFEITANDVDTYQRFTDGDLVISNNIFFNIAADSVFQLSVNGDVPAAKLDPAIAAVQASFADWNNALTDPMLGGISRMPDGGLNPAPQAGSPAFMDLADYPADNDFLVPVDYKGAFSGSINPWVLGWTYLSELGFLSTPASETITVTDNTGDGTTTWTKNNTYILDGLVFVDAGDTLVIEPGTIIKGAPGGGNDASALIVSRGGYIIADGTRDEPIIFTAEADDPFDPTDPISVNRVVGQWGGVIILGNAVTNNDTERTIEGVSAITTGDRALYGGDNDEDDSGIFRYVSIRHGGTKIGDGDEINGLTMGAVGSKTIIEFVEVAFNDDDGFEWFGGSVNGKYLLSFFNADDSFDWDQGWRGKGQFWFSIGGDGRGDHGGEHDGAGSGAAREPFGGATVHNATYLGQDTGEKRAVLMRENTGGFYRNSIFADFADGFAFELTANDVDTYQRLEMGDLGIENNIFHNITADDIFQISVNGDVPAADVTAAETFIADYFGTANNANEDPSFVSISREPNNMLDPRPQSGSAYANLATTEDDFFMDAPYKGAFGPDAGLWVEDWTYMDELGFLPADFQAIELPSAPDVVINEVDYDQEGTDSAEFIELKNNGDTEASLDGVSLQLVNGANGGATEYAIFDLSGNTIPAGDYFVIAMSENVPNTDVVVEGSIQNGSPDAIALWFDGAIFESLSYEGDVPGYVEGSGEGLEDVGGVNGLGLSRVPDGVDTDNNAEDFQLACITPGEANDGEDRSCFPTVTVVDGDVDGRTTWFKETTYVLSGLVFVEEGDTLVIEPGTIIKAEAGTGNDASALVISRGGYIIADGTRDEPIIFTALADDPFDPTDPISVNRAVGQWGGVIILGRARTNNDTERTIEGVSAITTGDRALYGGDNDEDDSGIFRYVSIRHGGSKIGDGDEINGLTMGAVGSGTQIDHVEVAFNDDDGFEWFGGTVNTSYLISFFNADDSFDWDQGFRGKGQFWFTIGGDGRGDHGGEHDGAGSGAPREPFGGAWVYNATYLGQDTGEKRAVLLRENTGGQYKNSIFADFADGFAFELTANEVDTYQRLTSGDLAVENNVFHNITATDIFQISINGDVPGADVTAAETFVADYFSSAGNVSADPKFVSISREPNNMLDPRPQGFETNSELAELPEGDDFFVTTTYKGAFDPAEQGLWADDWTYLDELGFLPETYGMTVSNEEEILASDLVVYPNPNNGSFTIKATIAENTPVRVEIINMVGSKVYDKEVRPFAGQLEADVDISRMNAGVYILQVRQGSKVSSFKMVKK